MGSPRTGATYDTRSTPNAELVTIQVLVGWWPTMTTVTSPLPSENPWTRGGAGGALLAGSRVASHSRHPCSGQFYPAWRRCYSRRIEVAACDRNTFLANWVHCEEAPDSYVNPRRWPSSARRSFSPPVVSRMSHTGAVEVIPAEAIAAIVAGIEPSSTVVGTSGLPGGLSSWMTRIEVQRPDGSRHRSRRAPWTATRRGATHAALRRRVRAAPAPRRTRNPGCPATRVRRLRPNPSAGLRRPRLRAGNDPLHDRRPGRDGRADGRCSGGHP